MDSLRRLVRSKCFCHENECCSKWGYCGRTADYCGEGCQSGPCRASYKRLEPDVVITPEVFQCAFPNVKANLREQRYKGLIEAMNLMKWHPENKDEAAIFLGHVAHETDGLITLIEYCAKQGTCNNYQSSWCSIEGKANVTYHGRGWFQLSYPCNYYHAGKALGLDLLSKPDLVSQSDKIAAATAIWYFKETEMDKLARKGAFGNTTRKLNEYECEGKGGYHMQAARVKHYNRVRECFGLPRAKENLTC